MPKANEVGPTCGVCLNYFLQYDPALPQNPDRRPFMVCSNGHSLCGICTQRIQERNDNPLCPICRLSFMETPIINRDLLSAVENLFMGLGEIEDIIDIKELAIESKPLSTGTFAHVYKAKWNTTDVAVKVLRPIQERKKQMKLISLEANLTIRLNHPNIIRFFGITTMLDERLAIVMELANRGSLEDYRRNMEPQLAIRVFLGIIDGLEYVHAKSIAHRDLKPANILMSGEPLVPKIADFGLAQVINTIVTNSAMVGTKYAAPELLTPKSEYGFSADIFSLAVMSFEIFSRNNFETDFVDNIMQIKVEIVREIRQKILATIPDPLKELISRGWAEAPHDRPSLSEFRSGLESMKTNIPAVSTVVSTSIKLSVVDQATDVANFSIALPVMLISWRPTCEFLHSMEARAEMVRDLRRKSDMSHIINTDVLDVMQVTPRHLFCDRDRLRCCFLFGPTLTDVIDRAYTYNRSMPSTSVSDESAPEVVGAVVKV